MKKFLIILLLCLFSVPASFAEKPEEKGPKGKDHKRGEECIAKGGYWDGSICWDNSIGDDPGDCPPGMIWVDGYDMCIILN